MNKIAINKLLAYMRENNIKTSIFATGAEFSYFTGNHKIFWQKTYDTDLPFEDTPMPYSLNNPSALLVVDEDGSYDVYAIPSLKEDLDGLDVNICYFANFERVIIDNVKAGKVALGAFCRDYIEKVIKTNAPFCEIVSAKEFIESLRMIKSSEEIKLLKNVAKFTDDAMSEIVKMLKDGVTQREIENKIRDIGILDNQIDHPFPPTGMFSKGEGDENEDIFTSYHYDKPLEEGCCIAFDFGYVKDGYCSDFGRSFFYGKAPEDIKNGYKALQKAQVFAVSSIIPNKTTIGEIYTNIEKSLEESGYFEYLRRYGDTGLIGHQIGIEVHENPWILKQDIVLKEGMVMCIEPKLHFKGRYYMRVEDMVLIEKDKAVFLTNFDRNLFEL